MISSWLSWRKSTAKNSSLVDCLEQMMEGGGGRKGLSKGNSKLSQQQALLTCPFTRSVWWGIFAFFFWPLFCWDTSLGKAKGSEKLGHVIALSNKMKPFQCSAMSRLTCWFQICEANLDLLRGTPQQWQSENCLLPFTILAHQFLERMCRHTKVVGSTNLQGKATE